MSETERLPSREAEIEGRREAQQRGASVSAGQAEASRGEARRAGVALGHEQRSAEGQRKQQQRKSARKSERRACGTCTRVVGCQETEAREESAGGSPLPPSGSDEAALVASYSHL